MSAKFNKNGVVNCTPIDGFDKVSIMKNDVIVGENLLKDTYTFKDWVQNNSAVSLIPNCYNGATATFSTSAWSYYFQNCSFEAGKTYTISAKVKCEVGKYVAFFTFSGNGQGFHNFTTDDWEDYSYTFTISESRTGIVRLENAGSTNGLYVALMKLEEGSKATPWCPNPADGFGNTPDTYKNPIQAKDFIEL